ncbi:MAG TPA: hypothetical protein PLZ57_09480 [Pseudobdellovibrionaceae bacterium]|nr:hypothetical protein [Pseudobdellovibrionaceae bacterium]
MTSYSETTTRTTTFIRIGGGILLGAAALWSRPAHTQAPVTPIIQSVPDPNATISSHRARAQRLFQALTAVRVPIDDPRLGQMEILLRANRHQDAAAVATADPLFYDVRVRDIARAMSTRDASVRASLNDFVTTFVGVVRDSDTTSAKELLTGNFIYQVDPTIASSATPAIRNTDNDIFTVAGNNAAPNHFLDLEARGLSMHSVLRRRSPQRAFVNGTLADHPDPAGLITSTAFMQAHAVAGTNRRLVEYTFKMFMCVTMPEWADGSAPDNRVARDVDRQPGGSLNTYLTSCKTCHAQMDGFRGAFAHVDFVNGQARLTPATVNAKMNRNANEFPAGYQTTNNSWVNHAINGKNSQLFGWRTPLQGNGMSEFGRAIAESRGFSRCMVKRVFEGVCGRSPMPNEEGRILDHANQFEVDNYHLRRLFERVALDNVCVQ